MSVVKEHLVRKIEPIYHSMATYHQHEVRGMDHVPEDGGGLIVFNHSLASYDMFLFCCALYMEKGRVVRTLIDKLFYKFPFLGEFMEELGAKQAHPKYARRLLRGKHLVGVAPGGMREALRPSSKKYEIIWEQRTGFARLAIETGVPVILAACPAADDIFKTYANPITDLAYQHLHIPLPIARGLGPTIIPRPVKLVHYLAEPLYPPPRPTERGRLKPTVLEFHAQLVDHMEKLMLQAAPKKLH